jgi:hypothetical protein
MRGVFAVREIGYIVLLSAHLATQSPTLGDTFPCRTVHYYNIVNAMDLSVDGLFDSANTLLGCLYHCLCHIGEHHSLQEDRIYSRLAYLVRQCPACS